MASGTFKGSRGVNQYGPWLTLQWSEVEQQVSNNRTKVRLTLRFHWDHNISYRFGNGKPGTLHTASYTFKGTATGTNGSLVLKQQDFWVSHNSDGSKSQKFTGNLRSMALNWSGTMLNTLTVSGTAKLTSIPRKSDLTSASITTLQANTASTLSIGRSVKYSGFYHLVTILDGSTWVWDPGYQKGSPPTSFSIPASTVNNMLNRMKNVTSKTFRVRLRTYTGSGGSGYIGESFRDLKVVIHSSQAPKINSVSISDAVTNIANDLGVYVQGRSRLKISMSVTPGYGASNKSFKITADGQSTTSSTLTTSEIKGSGALKIALEYVNSRNQKTTATKEVRVEPYTVPSIKTLNVERVEEQTEEEIENEVTRAKVKVKADISNLNNKNTNEFLLRYRPSGESSWSGTQKINDSSYSVDETIVLEDIDENLAYDIQFVASDYFRESSLERPLAPTFSLLNLHESGEGIAFGGVAQREKGVEFYLPAYFENDIYFREYPTTELQGEIDLNNVIDPGMYYCRLNREASTMVNVPEETAFSLLVERHAGFKQTFSTYGGNNGNDIRIYVRNYYAENWGSWKKIFG